MLTHKGTVNIETDRLLLRQFVMDDAKDMFDNWANDPEVTKFLLWTTHTDINVTKTTVSEWVESYSDLEKYHWAIIPKDFGKVIGSVSLVRVSNRNDQCEIGYCIGRAFWNMGYTSEAVKELIKFLFREVGFERIEALHNPDNPASGKVMEKAGMKFEGRLRKLHKDKNSNFYDCNIYSILREECID